MTDRDYTLGEVYRAIQELKTDDLAEIKGHLRILNGRVGTSEARIAALDERTAGDRRSGAMWGGGMAALVAGVLEGLHLYFSR